ncbi:MAG: DoxX family protein [Simkaniaceae bacterium]|jgi:putative oxidoreductase
MKILFLFIARLFFGLIFVVAGVSKIFNWSDTVESLVRMICNWHVYLEGKVVSSDMMQLLVTLSPLLIGIAIFLEIVGGLFVIVNLKMRLGAFLLLIFLIPTTIIFHPFWFELGSHFQVQMAMFMKNLSIMGALLYFLIEPRTALKKCI